MKLLYSINSPYARKVRVLVREKDLLRRVTEVVNNPSDRPPALLVANPLGKVPALILSDGSALFDSPVICEYLDHLEPAYRLLPTTNAKWPALRAQALADGVMDVAVAGVLERRRAASEQSASALAHWQEQMHMAVARMHNELAAQINELTIGHLALAVALSYLDFRYPDFQWREIADGGLVDWHADFAERPSMLETAPQV